MTRNKKLIARTPRALESVCQPRIDAVGRVFDKRSAGRANGNVKAMVIVQTPGEIRKRKQSLNMRSLTLRSKTEYRFNQTHHP